MTKNIETKYTGYVDKMIRFIESFRLSDPILWKRFVEQFRLHSDTADFGWRGEYWGKMMRGACFIYSYTHNEELYNALKATAEDMMSVIDNSGNLSTYEGEREFTGWDLWGRKYVLLGMQYFIEICSDEQLNKNLIDCMCKQLDYIISKIGPKAEGKKPITEATNHWRGLNSSSILEPVVKLYKLTKNKAYLDFAEYIVESGGTSVVNIFKLAYEDNFYPYQYPVTKAYEMTSCFEGLLEYYYVTNTEWHRTAIINYANKILESDFTIIGSSGCTHELFDHSTVRQANTTNEKIMQETCVTVTLMKFFYRLNVLTGDSKFADAFETSMYNAYFGSVNTENSIEPTIKDIYPDAIVEPLPFDSYSPLTAGTRGNGIGGLKLMPDNHYFGCCACIGAMGAGLIPKLGFLKNETGFVFNLFIAGEIKARTGNGNNIVFTIKTEYPKYGNVTIHLSMEKNEEFDIFIRNPYWSKKTSVSVNNEKVQVNDGYIKLHKNWHGGDSVDINLDMRTEIITPVPYGNEILMNKVVWGQNYMVSTYDVEDPIAKNHISLRRGPITLAMDNRLGISVDEPIKINKTGQYIADETEDEKNSPYKCLLYTSIRDMNGRKIYLTDYSSAGKLWNEESKMAAWLLTENEL